VLTSVDKTSTRNSKVSPQSGFLVPGITELQVRGQSHIQHSFLDIQNAQVDLERCWLHRLHFPLNLSKNKNDLSTLQGVDCR
jgi:hypothetical protein